MGVGEELAAVLVERYGRASTPLERPVFNARRVRARGQACVAKLIHYVDDDGEGGEFNRRRKAGFEMERFVYARLRRWPVKLVDSFSSRAGDVVVTTEYANDAWDAYVPSADADAKIARRLLAQVRDIHRLGVAHGDLLLKNILFRRPHGVAIIDFEKSQRCRRGSEQQKWDYWSLVEALLHEAPLRGVAFCALRELAERGHEKLAKRALANAVDNIAHNAAERAKMLSS
jgi:tRNA A-37 threonylcarbamoyl transferase component Bud32